MVILRNNEEIPQLIHDDTPFTIASLSKVVYQPSIYVILGCGGTGSWLVPQLIRFMSFEHHNKPVVIILCDGDIVEEKNIGRQNFASTDIGKNKATVLADRYRNIYLDKLPHHVIVPYTKYIEDYDTFYNMLENSIRQNFSEYTINDVSMKEMKSTYDKSTNVDTSVNQSIVPNITFLRRTDSVSTVPDMNMERDIISLHDYVVFDCVDNNSTRKVLHTIGEGYKPEGQDVLYSPLKRSLIYANMHLFSSANNPERGEVYYTSYKHSLPLIEYLKLGYYFHQDIKRHTSYSIPIDSNYAPHLPICIRKGEIPDTQSISEVKQPWYMINVYGTHQFFEFTDHYRLNHNTISSINIPLHALRRYKFCEPLSMYGAQIMNDGFSTNILDRTDTIPWSDYPFGYAPNIHHHRPGSRDKRHIKRDAITVAYDKAQQHALRSQYINSCPNYKLNRFYTDNIVASNSYLYRYAGPSSLFMYEGKDWMAPYHEQYLLYYMLSTMPVFISEYAQHINSNQLCDDNSIRNTIRDLMGIDQGKSTVSQYLFDTMVNNPKANVGTVALDIIDNLYNNYFRDFKGIKRYRHTTRISEVTTFIASNWFRASWLYDNFKGDYNQFSPDFILTIGANEDHIDKFLTDMTNNITDLEFSFNVQHESDTINDSDDSEYQHSKKLSSAFFTEISTQIDIIRTIFNKDRESRPEYPVQQLVIGAMITTIFFIIDKINTQLDVNIKYLKNDKNDSSATFFGVISNDPMYSLDRMLQVYNRLDDDTLNETSRVKQLSIIYKLIDLTAHSMMDIVSDEDDKFIISCVFFVLMQSLVYSSNADHNTFIITRLYESYARYIFADNISPSLRTKLIPVAALIDEQLDLFELCNQSDDEAFYWTKISNVDWFQSMSDIKAMLYDPVRDTRRLITLFMPLPTQIINRLFSTDTSRDADISIEHYLYDQYVAPNHLYHAHSTSTYHLPYLGPTMRHTVPASLAPWQMVLGSHLPLPSRFDYYPDAWNDNDKFASEISCADHAVENTQAMFVNQVGAMCLNNMFVDWMGNELNYTRVFFDVHNNYKKEHLTYKSILKFRNNKKYLEELEELEATTNKKDTNTND